MRITQDVKKTKDINRVETMKCICITCGTNKQNPKNGYCKNGHDNWLEPDDQAMYFNKASRKLGKTIEELAYAIENEIDLSIK